jgi:hypothetical protein
MAADWVGTHGRAPLQEFDVQHRQFKLVLFHPRSLGTWMMAFAMCNVAKASQNIYPE